MSEFLRFRTFVTPVLVQVVFWIGVVAAVIVGLVAMFSEDGGFFQGLLILLVGPLLVRIYAELLLLGFKIYEAVNEIGKQGRGTHMP